MTEQKPETKPPTDADDTGKNGARNGERQEAVLPADAQAVVNKSDYVLLFDELAFDNLVKCNMAGILPGAHLCSVSSAGAISDPASFALLNAGKGVTWVSHTKDGRMLARELADEYTVKHVTEFDPVTWNGVPMFKDLLAHSRKKKPRAFPTAAADSKKKPKPTPSAYAQRTKDGPDAFEVAGALKDKLLPLSMYAAGRGWYHRPAGAGLWQHDAEALRMREQVQGAEVFVNARKGTSVRATVTECESMLQVDGDLLDADDWTAGLPDGRVLNLRDGSVRDANGDADLITMALGCVPAAGEPELFQRVLAETFAHCAQPPETVQYLRWWARMALTGDCKAESMLFLFGPPGSGKSLIADTLAHVVGGYGATVSAKCVVGDKEQHLAWLAKLDRTRLVRINEMPRSGAWRTSDLLSMVSGETLTANHMRSGTFNFRSRMHVLASGNHAPSAPSSSGLWRRLRLIDCRNPVPSERQDATLREKLQAEAPRILSWLLSADMAEPAVPAEMLTAAASMATDGDTVGEWLEANYEHDMAGAVPVAEVYQQYVSEVGDANAVTPRAFGLRCTERLGVSFTYNRAKCRHCKRIGS